MKHKNFDIENNDSIAIPRRKRGKFNPTRQQIQQAVDDYLKRGGKIRKEQPPCDLYNFFMSITSDKREADEFLRG